ncbi:TlpA family protein disulfide reductase [Natrialbaceae archaeon A-chndr2]
MRRRDYIAGLGSLGVLATGGVVATQGAGPIQDRLQRWFGPDVEPLEVETADVRGSEPGTMQIPTLEGPMFLDFFGTWCPPCIEQMPALAAVHEHLGGEVTFVSITNEAVGASITEEELADWWIEHDGNWTVALDRNVELAERYGLSGYPLAVAIDEYGVVQWSETGVKTEAELIDGIEQAL